MAIQVNIAEAKARLSELVRRAEAGEQVILARDGKPVAALTAAPAAETERLPDRVLGWWEHLGPTTDEEMEELNRPIFSDEELDEMMDRKTRLLEEMPKKKR